MQLVQVGIATIAWCFLHSLLISHRSRDLIQRLFPRYHVFFRGIYVAGSTASAGVLMLWTYTLPQQTLWDWPGWWTWVRWIGLAESGVLLYLGARSYDNRTFLGLRQMTDHLAGLPPREPPFIDDGILGVIRHPWYAAGLLFVVFCLPYTDVNLVWRAVFFAYLLIGTELEERKLLRDLGETYAAYRHRVPRFIPLQRRW